MQAAIYLRVSTDEQAREGFSIDSQKERLDAFCKSQDWAIYDYYIDDGYSGKDLDRPAVKQLLKDAKEKKFDIVLIYRLDRFSRRALDLLKVVEEVFEPNKIFLRSATEPFDTSTNAGRMMLTMLVAFAQFERESIAERVKMNMMHKAKRGEWCGANQAPYGYKNVDKKLVVVPEEAAVIRKIFEWYASGRYGLRSLCEKLNNCGFRTRRGNYWVTPALRNVIVNPVYAGYMAWNRTKRKNTKTIRRKPSEWVVSEGRHEAIISKELFDQAQKILKERAKYTPRSAGSPYPLTGLVYCGNCGSKYRGWYKKAKKPGRLVYYYRCSGYMTGKICKSPHIQTHNLEEYVISKIERLGEDEKRIAAAYKQVMAANESKMATFKAEMQNAKKTLESIANKKKRYFEAFENNLLNPSDIKERIHELNLEQEKIRERIQQLEVSLSNLDNRTGHFEEIAEKIKNIRKLWEAADTEQRKMLMHLVVKKIIIHDRDNIELILHF